LAKKTGGNSRKKLNLILIAGLGGNSFEKRRYFMEAEDFCRVISEFEFICDDIDEIRNQIRLTRSETRRIAEAIVNIEKAKKILTDLFPNIQALNADLREDLAEEFADIC
jgi:hypothetical protein